MPSNMLSFAVQPILSISPYFLRSALSFETLCKASHCFIRCIHLRTFSFSFQGFIHGPFYPATSWSIRLAPDCAFFAPLSVLFKKQVVMCLPAHWSCIPVLPKLLDSSAFLFRWSPLHTPKTSSCSPLRFSYMFLGSIFAYFVFRFVPLSILFMFNFHCSAYQQLFASRSNLCLHDVHYFHLFWQRWPLVILLVSFFLF